MQRLESDEDAPLFIRKDSVVVLVDNISDDDIIQAPLNPNMDNRSRMNFAVAILLIIVGDARCLLLAAMRMAIACVYSTRTVYLMGTSTNYSIIVFWIFM